jgi:hypothetical protein
MILKPDGGCILLIPEDEFDRQLIGNWSRRESFRLADIDMGGLGGSPAMYLSMYLGGYRAPTPEYVNGVCCG